MSLGRNEFERKEKRSAEEPDNKDSYRRWIDQTLRQLGKRLEQGYSDEMLLYLKAMAHFHNYSLGNLLLISSQKPNATRVAGFRTWQKLKRKVRKGERAIRIFAPVCRKPQILSDQETDQPECKETAEQNGQSLSSHENDEQIVSYRTVCVFDVSQTEGKELPEPSKTTGSAADILPVLEHLIREHGLKLKYGNTGRALGLSTRTKIVIREDLDSAETFSTLVHELAHVLLHHQKDTKNENKTIKELEADAVACVVSERFEIQSLRASADYIKMWDGNTENLLVRLDRIRDCSARIIQRLEMSLPRDFERTSV